jgi:hypothetical protein
VDLAKTELDALFGSSKGASDAPQPSAADRARMELEALFKKK